MNYSVNSVNPAFGSTFLIPYSELQKKGNDSHDVMRKIGAETAKFSKPEDMQASPEGVLVKVDDSKDKEYLAIIAKYGVNIQKTDKKIEKNSAGDISAYSFMISKTHPQDAQARIKKYKEMEEPEKSKEYLNVYNEFKQSPFAHEKAPAKDVK